MATNPTLNSLAYRADIDGLRAFSIVVVVLFHAFPGLVPGGFVGVDVFFVISGYLITTIVLRQYSEQSFALWGFYSRRIRRIFPALLVVLLACVALGWAVLLPDEFAMLGREIAASAVFLPNVLFWTEAGYFDTENMLKPLLHLWSLGVEEQFYIVWPVVLGVILLRASRPLVPTVVLFSMSLVACIAMTRLDQPTSFYLPPFRAWELLLGAVLACMQRESAFSKAGSSLRELASAVGMALLLASLFLIDKQTAFPGAWPLLPTVGAGLMIFAGPDTGLNRRLLGNSFAVAIGKISYPLYLWHWPLLSLARMMEFGEPPPLVRAVIVGISVVLAILTYLYVEKPLRSARAPGVAVGLLAALLLMGAVGWTIEQNGGWPSRNAAHQQRDELLQWRGSMDQNCAGELGVPRACARSGPAVRVAVLGDSHSVNVFYAVAHHYQGSEKDVLRLGLGGCPPLYGVATRRNGARDLCLDVTAAHIDYVASSPDIEEVYLSSMARYLTPWQRMYQLAMPADPALDTNVDVYRAGLTETLDRLLAAGKSVVLVFDWPSVTFDPRSCTNMRPVKLWGKTRDDCRIPYDEFVKDHAVHRKLLREILLAYPSVKFWDPAMFICDTQFCWAKKEGVMLYRDHNHLSLSGARYIGERLQLQSLLLEN